MGKWDEINGCGACRGFWSFIKPPHYKFFNSACVLHDEMYNLGGTEKDRKKADKRLFDNMVKHSVEYFKESALSLWWFVTLSLLYYMAVRTFGKGSFNFNK